MRVAIPTLSAFLLAIVVPSTNCQQGTPAVQRDHQALLVLLQAAQAFGKTPRDSVATGKITVTAGSTVETGTIRVLTRGADETAEEIDTPSFAWTEIYSRGLANIREGKETKKPTSLEWAITSQSGPFPLPVLSRALQEKEFAFQYTGLEAIEGLNYHHIRIWNTFGSAADLRDLVEPSIRDIWIDAVTSLPRKISCVRRHALGDAPAIPLEVQFSDYRSVDGVQYPHSILKIWNGTPWQSISIQEVHFNTGLTDADFEVVVGVSQ